MTTQKTQSSLFEPDPAPDTSVENIQQRIKEVHETGGGEDPEEWRCPYCGRKVTTGATGVEYGHARKGYDSRRVPDKCPRRLDIVDPEVSDG